MVAFEKIYLVFQVVGCIVLRSGRKKADVRIKPCIATYLGYKIVESDIHVGIAVAELMALVNDYQTIVPIGQLAVKLS